MTLIGRELPEALAAEQGKLRELLTQAYLALQQEVKTNGTYHERLNERLSKLPEEIAAGVKPEAIAKAMSESFRQQLAATGIQEAQLFLAQSTRDLKRVTGEFDTAVKPLVHRYDGIATEMHNRAAALSNAADRLQEAAQKVDRKNQQLVDENPSLEMVGSALCSFGAAPDRRLVRLRLGTTASPRVGF